MATYSLNSTIAIDSSVFLNVRVGTAVSGQRALVYTVPADKMLKIVSIGGNSNLNGGSSTYRLDAVDNTAGYFPLFVDAVISLVTPAAPFEVQFARSSTGIEPQYPIEMGPGAQLYWVGNMLDFNLYVYGVLYKNSP